MNWDWLKSKFFWLNIVGIAIVTVEYLVNNNTLPQYAAIEGLIWAVLNAILAAIQSKTVTGLKVKLSDANFRISRLTITGK
jgi:hypothetical protein